MLNRVFLTSKPKLSPDSRMAGGAAGSMAGNAVSMFSM